MLCVVILSLVFLIVDASNRRLITQMNNIKKEIGFINDDISSLFQNIEDINKTVISNSHENPMVRMKGVKGDQLSQMDYGKPNGIDSRHIVALFEGFESEKKLIRLLLIRLEALETKVSETDILLEAEKKVSQHFQNSLQVLQTQVNDINLVLVSEQGKNQRLEKHIASLGVKQTLMNESNAALTKALVSSNEKQLKILQELELLKESNFDTRKELESQTHMNRQLQIEIDVMKTMCTAACNNEALGHNSSNIKPEIIEQTPQHSHAIPLYWTTVTPEVTTNGVPHLNDCTSTTRSGIYNYDFYIDSHLTTKSVYCDADTDGGGWIIIMRRKDGSVNFNKNWDEYKNGFGNLDGEFWIGNEFIHTLTKSQPMELRIDMKDFDDLKAFAEYEVFRIGSEADKYDLTVSGYSGTAGDSFSNVTYAHNVHNGMKFSTFDSDNDLHIIVNCAKTMSGGWWFNACGYSHLTGVYDHEPFPFWYEEFGNLKWETWPGIWINLDFIEMKLRQKIN